MTDFKQRMAKGAVWMVLLKLVERGTGFVSTLFLARLLIPADFGLVAMATSFLAALELLSAFSFDLALIQNQNAERRHYDTAWSFALIFGTANAFLMCAVASTAADFFAEPRVEGLMYALALSPLIGGFDNVRRANFDEVWWTEDGLKWQRLDTKTRFSPRHEVTAYVHDNSLWVVAGNSWPLMNDVWKLTLTVAHSGY